MTKAPVIAKTHRGKLSLDVPDHAQARRQLEAAGCKVSAARQTEKFREFGKGVPLLSVVAFVRRGQPGQLVLDAHARMGLRKGFSVMSSLHTDENSSYRRV
jgi:hypothetical protein